LEGSLFLKNVEWGDLFPLFSPAEREKVKKLRGRGSGESTEPPL